jgi:hypothetical protein
MKLFLFILLFQRIEIVCADSTKSCSALGDFQSAIFASYHSLSLLLSFSLLLSTKKVGKNEFYFYLICPSFQSHALRFSFSYRRRLVTHFHATGETSARIIDPKFIDPDYIDPKIISPKFIKPDYIDPNIMDPDFIKPNFINPNIIDPNFIKPNVIDPKIIDPNFIKSDFIKPDFIEP